MGCPSYIPLASLSRDLGKKLGIDGFSCSCCECNIKAKTIIMQATHEWLDPFKGQQWRTWVQLNSVSFIRYKLVLLVIMCCKLYLNKYILNKGIQEPCNCQPVVGFHCIYLTDDLQERGYVIQVLIMMKQNQNNMQEHMRKECPCIGLTPAIADPHCQCCAVVVPMQLLHYWATVFLGWQIMVEALSLPPPYVVEGQKSLCNKL